MSGETRPVVVRRARRPDCRTGSRHGPAFRPWMISDSSRSLRAAHTSVGRLEDLFQRCRGIVVQSRIGSETPGNHSQRFRLGLRWATIDELVHVKLRPGGQRSKVVDIRALALSSTLYKMRGITGTSSPVMWDGRFHPKPSCSEVSDALFRSQYHRPDTLSKSLKRGTCN